MKTLSYKQSPSVLAYMLRALLPSPGLRKVATVPPMVITQKGFLLTPEKCLEFFELCDMPFSEELPIILPQVLGFRLLMRAVTDPSYPAPIWDALQVRNELNQIQVLNIDDRIDLELITGEQRFLEKGVEVDFILKAIRKGETAWIGKTTFYYRGKFKQNTGEALRPPEIKGEAFTSFALPRGGGLRFGNLSGDFNGIHLFDPYARMLGFKRAFLHPHRVAGAALSRLKRESKVPQKLELWFRGPAPYGETARLHTNESNGQTVFSVFAGDQRPGLIGRLS